MKISIKPCPFCGKRAEIVYTMTNQYKVKCSSCKARTAVTTTKEQAIYAWNRRIEA
jgi:Lar family restriction alleviation protein